MGPSSARVVPTKRDDIGTETLQISDEDAAFVLGKQGRTKIKLARVSECDIELNEGDNTLEFTGTSVQRRRAQRYARCVMAQRVGPVVVTAEDVEDECTVLVVPQEAIGLVTGKGGHFLRTLEDEHGTLMCFGEQEGVEPVEGEVDLIIFGSRTGRRGAQLAVMNIVESKVSGFYTDRWRSEGMTFDTKADLVGDWGTSTAELSQEELAYAIGPQGRTRKKLARASGCIIQYVGPVVFMTGPKRLREYAKDYLKWLFAQLEGPVEPNILGRTDATMLEVPQDCTGYVLGRGRETMGLVEETFGTMMFFVGDSGPNSSGKEEARLAIFGPERARRGSELMVMSLVERKKEGYGYYTEGLEDLKTLTKGFDTDRLIMQSEDMAYALGKEGATRQKLAVASNAILQFVGPMAFIAGTAKERQRCRDYLGWLLEQKDGGYAAIDPHGRDDVTELQIGEDDVPWLMKTGMQELRRIEQETGTFCCICEGNRLLICGHEEGSQYSDTGRVKAESLVWRLLQGHARDAWSYKSSNGWSRARSRTPPRQRWRDTEQQPAPPRRQQQGSNWEGRPAVVRRWEEEAAVGAEGEEGDVEWWPEPRQRAAGGRPGGWAGAVEPTPALSSRPAARSPTPPWRKKSGPAPAAASGGGGGGRARREGPYNVW